MAFAVGQLAVFQGASEAPIVWFIRVERATQKNSQLATARRVAMKMGRRLRFVGYVSIQICALYRQSGSDRLAGGPF